MPVTQRVEVVLAVDSRPHVRDASRSDDIFRSRNVDRPTTKIKISSASSIAVPASPYPESSSPSYSAPMAVLR